MTDKTKFRAARRSSRAWKYGLGFAAVFLLLGILGFLALPPIIRHVAVDRLSEALHRPVSIRKIAVNPFALTLEVEGLDIGEREGGASFAGFENLYVNLQASSLFRWGPVVDEIRLVGPKFHVARLAGDRYNFSDLIDEFMARPKKNEEGPTPAFSLNNIQISGGTLEFDDRVVGEKSVVENITVALPFVSSMDYATNIFVEPHFSATVNGAHIDLKGRSKPFTESQESEFLLTLNEVRLPKYFAYLPVRLPMKLESGALSTELTLAFDQESGKMPHLRIAGTVSVENLKATDPAGQALLAFKRLDVAVGSADVFGGRFVIDRVALDSPEITVRVNRAGAIDWLDMLPPAADPAGPDGRAATPVAWSLGEARISKGALRWDDASNPRVFRADVKIIDALVKNLDAQGSVADFEAALAIDGGESLKVDALTVKEGKLDPAKRRIQMGDVRLDGARASITRLADGRIEWIEPPARHLPVSARKDAPAPWTLDVAKSAGKGIRLRFEDAAVSPRAAQDIEDLDFELSKVSSEPGRAADVKMGFRFNHKGKVTVDGTLGAMPLDADLNVDVRTIELLPLQPYFSEKLNIDVTRGHVTLDGKLRLRQSAAAKGEKNGKRGKDTKRAQGGAPDASGLLTGGFAGRLTIGDFQAVEKSPGAGDARTAEKTRAAGKTNPPDFLHWKSLRFDKVDARLGPESVAIGGITLADFFARVIISPQGELNLLKIARAGEETAVNAEAAAPPAESSDGKAAAPIAVKSGSALPVTIGRVTLRGGNIRFTDNFVKPNYTANLGGISGSVTGLSSRPGTQAALELRGSYDKVAPLDVSARINPLSAKPYLDLRANVKDIDLTTLSAYSGKYAGYAIEKGKLSLSVNYRIENDQLEAENRLFLDQLTFGDAVESPDATTLPVRLAVSLLKNRNGEIDINLPVSGSLDDPHFSVGGLIVEMFVNLLTKAATSPFALIGSMFGGEELSDVEFDPGRAALTPEAVERLGNLARALTDRPALKFEIEGRADPVQDIEGLKRARLERKLGALKRKDMAGQDEDGKSAAGSARVTEQEYPALLERVYRAENFPKPRNMIGLTKSLPVEEMEKLILANTTVNEDDLKNLGDRRAKAVRDWLIAHEVASEQIFLLPSKTGAIDEDKSGRRACFSLK
ncbi:MAG: DUF748 domain-containing protein [Candidatus Accumulibacter sp.]|jgi:uncharacterized protein involved in outer membrane biogenesis|nr:DUF748 domain-containing protein [Accumulibacter sp.]